ncbi:MAG: carboxymuconolactone decarboxylase family protein [bacterium]|nr:carboxymuconolactone decarboxylase family protein [bacterium]
MDKKKVTAGRDLLGDLAPKFAELNDDILFGQVWSREIQLSPRDRSLITVSALISSGIFNNSLKSHLKRALQNGVTREELVEAITHLAFYAGWPKAWATFPLLKEVFAEEDSPNPVKSLFGKGEPIPPELSQYFSGKVYIKTLVSASERHNLQIANVTFEPGCRNNWHSHSKGQILLITDGRGWYQELGKSAQELRPGDIVDIPSNVKHWHGAGKDSWFAHISIIMDSQGTEWFEAVSEEEYSKLP